MRLNIALLGLTFILLSTQLVSAHAATCDNIWIDAEDITMESQTQIIFIFQFTIIMMKILTFMQSKFGETMVNLT